VPQFQLLVLLNFQLPVIKQLKEIVKLLDPPVLKRHVIMHQLLKTQMHYVQHFYQHVQLLELEVVFQELLVQLTQHHLNVEIKMHLEVVAIGVLQVYHVSI